MSPAGSSPALPRAWSRGLLLLAMLTAGGVYLYLGRETAPFFDEWSWITGRRDWTATALLDDHNGHLSLVPALIHKVAYSALGFEGHTLLRVLTVACHLLIGLLVYRFVAQRQDEPIALLGAILILGLGAGSIDVIWPFQLSFLLSVAGGVLALHALESSSARAPLVVAGGLLLAIASSGLGVVFVAGLLASAAWRRDRATLLAVAAPLALYVAWYLAFARDASEATTANLPLVGDFAATMAAAAAGGLAGLDLEFGRVLIILAAAGVASIIVRGLTPSPTAIAAMTAFGALLALTALSRAQFAEPAAPRYVYPGAVLLLLSGSALLVGRRAGRRAWAVGAALTAFAVLAGLGDLRNTGRAQREAASTLRAQLAAYEVLPTPPAPEFVPAPSVAPQLSAAGYRGALDAYGPFLDDVEETLGAALSADRAAADDTLLRLGAVVTGAPPRGSSTRFSAPEIVNGRAARGNDRCLVVRAGAVEVHLPPGSTLQVTPQQTTDISFRRFGDAFIGARPLPAATIAVTPASDRAERPWMVRIGGGRPKLCLS